MQLYEMSSTNSILLWQEQFEDIKGLSEDVNQRMAYNTMANRKALTIVYKILHRKLEMQQQELYSKR